MLNFVNTCIPHRNGIIINKGAGTCSYHIKTEEGREIIRNKKLSKSKNFNEKRCSINDDNDV